MLLVNFFKNPLDAVYGTSVPVSLEKLSARTERIYQQILRNRPNVALQLELKSPNIIVPQSLTDSNTLVLGLALGTVLHLLIVSISFRFVLTSFRPSLRCDQANCSLPLGCPLPLRRLQCCLARRPAHHGPGRQGLPSGPGDEPCRRLRRHLLHRALLH